MSVPDAARSDPAASASAVVPTVVAAPPGEKLPVTVGNGVKVPLIILATIAVLAALDYGESVAMPVMLAFIVSLTLTPINMWLQRRIPPPVSALILVAALTFLVAVAALTLSQPVLNWIADAPQIGATLREKLAEIRAPLARLTRLGEEVDRITEATADPLVQEVVLRQPGLMNRAATNISATAASLVISVALTYFLLATNRLIYEKIIYLAPRLSDKKRALTTLNTIVSSVATYLLTITTINIGFGVVIGLIMWALGMPDPVLWAIAAFFLKFLPFVGLIIGTLASAVVGLLVYDTLLTALIPGLAYFALSTIEGNFVAPHVVGHRLELNPGAILLSIALWGFLWGVIGVVLAVPVLIVMKVICDNVDSLAAIGQFLSGATVVEQEEDDAAQVNAAHSA